VARVESNGKAKESSDLILRKLVYVRRLACGREAAGGCEPHSPETVVQSAARQPIGPIDSTQA
jgi:hypothetical protein